MDIGLRAALDATNTKQNLAKLLGVSTSYITRWGEFVPKKWVEDVSRVTGVPLLELRPETREALRVERLNWPPRAVENIE
ncbi:MAG: Cro/CI family transcriptional regulator [Hyphomicrobiales bacterium]